MKKCIFCGHLNNDNSQFCVNCGNKLEYRETIDEKVDVEVKQEIVESVVKKDINNEVYSKVEENSLATVALILGLISLGCLIAPMGLSFAVVISLFAITVGIVSIIRKPNIARKKSILGIVMGCVALVISVVVFIVAGPVIEIVKEYLQSYCMKSPNSDECLMLEEMLPNLFK